MPINAGRNLLFGVLALRAGLLGAGQFTDAYPAWARRPDTPLADLLVERELLSADDRTLVEQILESRLREHAGDVPAALASLLAEPARGQPTRPGDDPDRPTAASQPPHPGEILLSSRADQAGTHERYTLTRLHARGGIGRVWLARDEDLGREVALKELLPDWAHKPSIWARFVEEAKITGQLEHPSIVPVYELASHPDGRPPYYTMRFIRGRTLGDEVRAYHRCRETGQATPLEQRRLLGAFVAVCHAVAYAHSRGVLHRDLKGQNIVLGEYGEVIVLDWGLAKLLRRQEPHGEVTPVALEEAPREETVAGQVLGTPAFMSPEQAQGRLRLDERTDVYGLGAVLYQILAGQPPFTGENTRTLLHRVQHQPPVPPRRLAPETPAALEAVCLKALAKDPADRYASAGEVAEEVQHWLADEPVRAYPEPWPTRARRWLGRHRTLATAGAATVLVAGVCLAAATALLTAANRRERDLRTEATRQRDEATREKERADQNLARARQAVEDYCTSVADDRRLREAGFHQLRKKLLETAVPFFEEFVRQRAGDEGLLADQGRAYYRLARIRAEMGETAQAMDDYAHMHDIFARLVQSHPTQPDYRRSLAISDNNRAILYGSLGQRGQAEAAYRRALALHQRLAKDFPGVPEYRKQLAITYNNLGSVLRDLARRREAEQLYRKGLALLERLAAEFPNVPEYRRDLGWSQLNLGTLLRDFGRAAEATQYYHQAQASYEQLAADFPGVADYRRYLAWCSLNLGDTARDAERFRDARPFYERAVTILDRLLADFPGALEYAADLALASNGLGDAERQSGRAADSLPRYERFISLLGPVLAKSPGNVAAREALREAYRGRARALASLGRPQEARRDWDRALEADPDSGQQAMTLAYAGRRPEALARAEALARQGTGESLYAAACVHAILAGVGPDRQHEADQAMELLRQAVAKGYQDAVHLKEENALAALRGRKDFQKLVRELEAQAGPGAVSSEDSHRRGRRGTQRGTQANGHQ